MDCGQPRWPLALGPFHGRAIEGGAERATARIAAMNATPENSDQSADLQNADLRDFSGRLLLVGAGKMGSALLDGWLRLGLDAGKVAVLEPRPTKQIEALAARGLWLNPHLATLGDAGAIVLAIKPQDAAAAIAPLAPLARASTLIVSIMAGRTLRFLAGAFNDTGAIVRAMPNTPAAIGRGITVAVPFRAGAEQRRLAQRLLAAGGAVEWIDDEALMDAVTAVSGSGPAYVFLLAEALAQAGAAAGLPAALAQKLARETVSGSGELLHRSTLDAAVLRQNVTSPGGTTAAALQVLMADNGIGPLLRDAVAAATARSRALAG
jgi:pyrroline-5-carboxylate reductase